MMGINIEDSIPKPLLWTVSTPFMILLFPLGFFYSMFLLVQDIRLGEGLSGFKRDGFFAMLRPGFYVGLFVSLILLVIASLPLDLMEKTRNRRKSE